MISFVYDIMIIYYTIDKFQACKAFGEAAGFILNEDGPHIWEAPGVVISAISPANSLTRSGETLQV